ncbi:hypothetical protein [Nocardiopsis salina]|uniref:hypothetical protein n=1 Tax=Nocardiopsis salina TaxID=245836 RepID=UPI00034A8E98|nr:hypothetical protein [Nocardiopsis salina]
MTEIEFVDHLPNHDSRSGPRAWGHTIAHQLTNRPGQWALILTGKPGTPQIYNRRRVIAKGITVPWRPEGAFEARSFTIDGELRLYARYVAGLPSDV